METTINNAPNFAPPKTHQRRELAGLRKVGAATNARFLAALGEGQPGLPEPATLESVVLPTDQDGQRARGLRFGDRGPWPCWPRWPTSATSWAGSPTGRSDSRWRSGGARLRQGQASYDLRRLRLKGVHRTHGLQQHGG